MKIAVLNGSPKGDYSITLQSVLYLKKRYTEHSFTILNVGNRIKSIEKNPSEMIRTVEEADMILFAYPVYTFLVPSQMHRAIEILKENHAELSGKFAVQISTSKHFYDVTAHGFIRENAEDMGMKYIDGLSADMEDLLSEKGREELEKFWEYTIFRTGLPDEDGAVCKKEAATGKDTSGVATTGNPCNGQEAYNGDSKDGSFDIAIVTDCKNDPLLESAIGYFRNEIPYKSHIVDISGFGFKGGCLGCFHCAGDGVCIYKDGFADFLKKEVLSSSAVVYAFTVRDHSMGSTFKMYDDRQFCNGHRMMTIGMPIGYIVKGDLSKEANLETVMKARASVGRNILCGIVPGTTLSPMETGISNLARKIAYTLEHRTLPGSDFYGVGGTKIFRDLIYIMRGLMTADHKFYKKHGIYDDLPQRHMGKMLQMKIIGFLANNPKIRAKMGNKMNEGIVAPYRKILDGITAKR